MRGLQPKFGEPVCLFDESANGCSWSVNFWRNPTKKANFPLVYDGSKTLAVVLKKTYPKKAAPIQSGSGFSIVPTVLLKTPL